MKIRNHRKYEWVFIPHEDAKMRSNVFKYKSELIKYLYSDFEDSLGGIIRLQQDSFSGSNTVREYYVWFNRYANMNGAKPKIVLKQMLFRGRKFVCKIRKVSKLSKRYYAFRDKINTLMISISENDIPTTKQANNLVELFYKSGFKDFKPTIDDFRYINGHISDGIDFYHWSDRCNNLRTKTIIEYFKRNNLIN